MTTRIKPSDFVQTLLVTAYVEPEVPQQQGWQLIWSSNWRGDRLVQFWLCTYDLKECFNDTAREVFGDAVLQVARLGDHPKIENVDELEYLDDYTKGEQS